MRGWPDRGVRHWLPESRHHMKHSLSELCLHPLFRSQSTAVDTQELVCRARGGSAEGLVYSFWAGDTISSLREVRELYPKKARLELYFLDEYRCFRQRKLSL